MKYNAEDIKIEKNPKYEGDGLDIYYTIRNKKSDFLLRLSNTSLTEALVSLGYCQRYDEGNNEIERSGEWIPLHIFMQGYQGYKLAIKLILNYLNNKTEKP